MQITSITRLLIQVTRHVSTFQGKGEVVGKFLLGVQYPASSNCKHRNAPLEAGSRLSRNGSREPFNEPTLPPLILSRRGASRHLARDLFARGGNGR